MHQPIKTIEEAVRDEWPKFQREQAERDEQALSRVEGYEIPAFEVQIIDQRAAKANGRLVQQTHESFVESVSNLFKSFCGGDSQQTEVVPQDVEHTLRPSSEELGSPESSQAPEETIQVLIDSAELESQLPVELQTETSQYIKAIGLSLNEGIRRSKNIEEHK